MAGRARCGRAAHLHRRRRDPAGNARRLCFVARAKPGAGASRPGRSQRQGRHPRRQLADRERAGGPRRKDRRRGRARRGLGVDRQRHARRRCRRANRRSRPDRLAHPCDSRRPDLCHRSRLGRRARHAEAMQRLRQRARNTSRIAGSSLRAAGRTSSSPSAAAPAPPSSRKPWPTIRSTCSSSIPMSFSMAKASTSSASIEATRPPA